MVAIRKDIFLRLKSQVPFFHGFSDVELLAFLRLMKVQHANPGKLIFKEYDPGDTMYILFSGSVEITKKVGKQDGEVSETLICQLEAGETFGELGMLDHRPRSASARAKTKSLLFYIGTEKLERISKNPGLSYLSFKLYKNFSTMLASRLRDTNQKVVNLEAQRLG